MVDCYKYHNNMNIRPQPEANQMAIIVKTDLFNIIIRDISTVIGRTIFLALYKVNIDHLSFNFLYVIFDKFLP